MRNPSDISPLKIHMTSENHHFLIGDTSSNGCLIIVMLVFGGVSPKKSRYLASVKLSWLEYPYFQQEIYVQRVHVPLLC